MGRQMSLQAQQQHGAPVSCSAPTSRSWSLARGPSSHPQHQPTRASPARLPAPSVPTSKLLLFCLLMTVTSCPVSVGVVNKPHAGNMGYKYQALASPSHGADGSNLAVTLDAVLLLHRQPTPGFTPTTPGLPGHRPACLQDAGVTAGEATRRGMQGAHPGCTGGLGL